MWRFAVASRRGAGKRDGAKPKWQRVGLLTVCVSALALIGVGMGGTADGMFRAAARDVGGLLNSRSPGVRSDGVLLQTKVAHAAGPPRSRVLSGTRTRPAPVLPDAGAFVPGLPDVPLNDFGAPPGDFANGVPFGPLPLAAAPPFIPGGGVLPPAGPTPEAPVPEPDTYATLALGIGLIGAVLRRRRRPVAGDPDMEPGSERHARTSRPRV